MGSIDVQSAFHSMTLPPPLSGEHEWRAAIPIEPGDYVGIPIVSDGSPYECPDLERLDEIGYLEERPRGAPHDHVSWVVVGRSPT